MGINTYRQGGLPLSKTLRKNRVIRVLTGLVRCGVCGKKYVLATGRKDKKYYACYSARWESSCGNRYIQCDHTEDLVKSVVCQRVDTIEEEILRAIQEGPSEEQEYVEVRDIIAERADIRRKMGNLVDAISEGIIPKDLAAERMKSFQNALERLTSEERALEHHVEKKNTSDAILAELEGLPEGWAERDEVLRAVYLTLVDRVEVTPSNITIYYKAPISPDTI